MKNLAKLKVDIRMAIYDERVARKNEALGYLMDPSGTFHGHFIELFMSDCDMFILLTVPRSIVDGS